VVVVTVVVAVGAVEILGDGTGLKLPGSPLAYASESSCMTSAAAATSAPISSLASADIPSSTNRLITFKDAESALCGRLMSLAFHLTLAVGFGFGPVPALPVRFYVASDTPRDHRRRRCGGLRGFLWAKAVEPVPNEFGTYLCLAVDRAE
jgi:hypothetical protein